MNNVIPWWEIETWFKGHLKKERKKTGRPSYLIILMFKIRLIQQCVISRIEKQNFKYVTD